MKLRIFDVGRMKKSTSVDIPDDYTADDIAHALYVVVRKMKALGSRDIEVTWDPETNTGEVYAGIRSVGRVERLTP